MEVLSQPVLTQKATRIIDAGAADKFIASLLLLEQIADNRSSAKFTMDASSNLTYRALIKPISPRSNLANISAQPSSQPCEDCAHIIPDKRKAVGGLIKIKYERIDQYPNFPSLKSSAKDGCELCRFFRKTIRNAWAARPMEEWGVGPLREGDGLWDDLLATPWDGKVKIHKVTFRLDSHSPTDGNGRGAVVSLGLEFGPATTPDHGNDGYGDIGRIIGFKVFDIRDLNSVSDFSRRQMPSHHSLSEDNIELVTKWISDCKDCHQECKFYDGHFIPGRLLDCGPSDGSIPPRLVENHEVESEARYAALSHMWGDMNNYPPLRTLKSNYADLRDSIQLGKLPKNFVNAIEVVRSLNLQYLWIDSLCIVQDDSADWGKEAKTMHLVYSHAEITIVATSATSTHDGFLNRDLFSVPAVKVKYSLEDSPVWCYMIIAAQDDVESGTWHGDVEASLWNTRGWTMQERKLATRMLHFCKNKLYFECRRHRLSEENEKLPPYRNFDLWPRNHIQMNDRERSTIEMNLYSTWIRTVTEYSQRKLTKDFDKLTAIESVASEMVRQESFTYIPFAGMWEQMIQHGLLWQVRDGPVSRPAYSRAPTWSWAYIDCRLGWDVATFRADSGNHREYLEVLSMGSGDGLANRFLKVKALLIPIAFMIECDHDDRWLYGSRGNFPYDVFNYQTPEDLEETGIPHRYLSLDGRLDAIGNGDCTKVGEARLDMDDKDNLTTSGRPLFYMHVKERGRPSGLVVERVMVDSVSTWKRVGVATIYEKGGEPFSKSVWETSSKIDELTLV